MCSSTATLRFPGAMNTRLLNLIGPLIAFPPMRFIQTGWSFDYWKIETPLFQRIAVFEEWDF